MGLFNGKAREERKQEKINEYASERHVGDLLPEHLEAMEKIANTTGELGSIIGVGHEKIVELNHLQAFLNQNWMILSQLNKLNEGINKLNENIEKMNNK